MGKEWTPSSIFSAKEQFFANERKSTARAKSNRYTNKCIIGGSWYIFNYKFTTHTHLYIYAYIRINMICTHIITNICILCAVLQAFPPTSGVSFAFVRNRSTRSGNTWSDTSRSPGIGETCGNHQQGMRYYASVDGKSLGYLCSKLWRFTF